MGGAVISREDCCRSLFLKYIFGNGCCKDKTSHHVVLGPRVLSQVQVQATLPFQPLATDVAHKILLHRVLDHVLLQRMLIRASLVTFGTVHNFALSLFRDNSMINLITEVRQR